MYFVRTHSLIQLFGSDFGQYKSVQEVYKNAIHCRVFATPRCTPVSDLKDVHRVYKALWALTLWCSLYTHSLIELFRSDFGEPHKSVQEVYENVVCCRWFAMAW